ncbi:MAG: hypothetical protein ACRC33_14800 [Gemmataceae bacterium]
MGVFDFTKECVRCAKTPVFNWAWLLTQCCEKKLCEPGCTGAWRKYLNENRKCPYCNKPFDPDIGFLGG